MNPSMFMIEHILRSTAECKNISFIAISDNNHGGKLIEINFNDTALLKELIDVSDAMNHHGEYYIKNNKLTLYCHILPNGIISDRAEL